MTALTDRPTSRRTSSSSSRAVLFLWHLIWLVALPLYAGVRVDTDYGDTWGTVNVAGLLALLSAFAVCVVLYRLVSRARS